MNKGGILFPLEEMNMEIPQCKKCRELAQLLVECRDALPAISISSARLHGVKLDLAIRIEAAMEPWEVKS